MRELDKLFTQLRLTPTRYNPVDGEYLKSSWEKLSRERASLSVTVIGALLLYDHRFSDLLTGAEMQDLLRLVGLAKARLTELNQPKTKIGKIIADTVIGL